MKFPRCVCALPSLSRFKKRRFRAIAWIASCVAIAAFSAAAGESLADMPVAAPSKAALTVAATALQAETWPVTVAANGSIAAWQEAVIGAEIGNLRIAEVLVNVGDAASKGQVLARLDSDSVANELAEAKAAVAEMEATLAEARANSERARKLQAQGFFSPQQGTQSITAELSALARLDAARARQRGTELRWSKTTIVAPDHGVISARAATPGSLTQPGQELFRLIRGNRLEWRAEVTAAELGRFKPGDPASLIGPNGQPVRGKVRSVAPTVDPQTRNGLVYVDLATGSKVRAGMFARGEFELGVTPALTLPQSAVLLREGFAYVFRIDGAAAALNKVSQAKVTTGRRKGDRIEITGGLAAGQRVVSSGSAFLADGDTVRVVASSAMTPEKRP